jgi:hypothetical protein
LRPYEDRRIFGDVAAVLRRGDFRRRCFSREGEAVTGSDPFPVELLDRLRELVLCEFVTDNELDQPAKRVLVFEGWSRVGEVDASEPHDSERTFWRLKHQHPLCAYQAKSGDFAAHKLSDFIPRRQLRKLEPANRVVLTALSRLLPRTRWSTFLVAPARLLRWHRPLVARRWTYLSRKPVRPSVAAGVRRWSATAPRSETLRIPRRERTVYREGNREMGPQ